MVTGRNDVSPLEDSTRVSTGFVFDDSIDLVNIWILALLIIGYRFTVRKSLSTATRAASVVSLFLVYIALRLAYATILGV